MHNDEVISSNAHLYIEKLDTSNQGEYVCTAANENGASKIALNLNVLCEYLVLIECCKIEGFFFQGISLHRCTDT